MLKLYVQKIANVSPCIEVVESTFQVDGYDFGDRLLEGVMFNVTFKNKEILSVKVDESALPYFEDLNQKKWLTAAGRYAQNILDNGGDEVRLSDKLKQKYDFPQVAFIVDESKIY